MEKIGYKSPTNLFGGSVLKGDLYVKYNKLSKFYSHSDLECDSYNLPSEIVEQWEPIYRVGLNGLKTLCYEAYCSANTVFLEEDALMHQFEKWFSERFKFL